MLKPGDAAPDFAVGDSTLHAMLADKAVVVFFFPRAFTPGCTLEAGGFCREHDRLRSLGCEVVGVSSDSQEANDRFGASLDLTYPLVGDKGGKIARAYGVRWPLIGLARRASFLVGRDGRVRAALHSERHAESHITEALEAARGLSR